MILFTALHVRAASREGLDPKGFLRARWWLTAAMLGSLGGSITVLQAAQNIAPDDATAHMTACALLGLLGSMYATFGFFAYRWPGVWRSYIANRDRAHAAFASNLRP